jgi:hypothetical protein
MDIFILKAATREEVANQYGITSKTLARWLKKSNITLPPGRIDPLHLEIIYLTFGYPKSIKIA